MKTKEEIEEKIKILERELQDSSNYSSGIEYGEAEGWLAALKWVLNQE